MSSASRRLQRCGRATRASTSEWAQCALRDSEREMRCLRACSEQRDSEFSSSDPHPHACTCSVRCGREGVASLDTGRRLPHARAGSPSDSESVSVGGRKKAGSRDRGHIQRLRATSRSAGPCSARSRVLVHPPGVRTRPVVLYLCVRVEEAWRCCAQRLGRLKYA